MPQFWIAIFFILLAATQLYQSIKDINLPFPVYLVLGTVLAVAANSQHKFSFIPHQQVIQAIKAPEPVLSTQTAPILTATEATTPVQLVETIESKQPRTRKQATPKSK
jgi:hypothetical protein